MSTAKRLHYSYAEYLSLLNQAEIKLEYCEGVIYAMAGGSLAHGALSAAVMRVFGVALAGRCTVYSSDVKVRIEASDLSTFPDVSVVCGPPQTSAIDSHALTNPTLVVEVTSPSTEDYDRSDKLSHYKQLASVQAVLFVSHRTASITVVQRTSSGWQERTFRSSERVELSVPQVSFSVDDVYAGIALDAASPSAV